jgi:hypothetical protein
MKKIIALLILFGLINTLHPQPFFQKITIGIVATDSGSYSMAAWGDYDGNGYQDMIVAPWNDGCWSCRSPIRFYKNNGNGTFSRGNNILEDQILSCNGAAWGDYDNDGKIDLIVTRYFNQKNLLFHNEGNGDFLLVSSGPISTETASSTGPAWCDYDKDGWLDLFISHGQNQNNALYNNNGNGTFTRITSGAIVNDGGDSRACAWGDYNNDGWPDLYVVNYGVQNNFLYHNNGNGTFTKITSVSPVTTPGYGAGCSWLDYDNDGWLDLLVTYNAANDRLYHNNHDGTFTLTNLAPSQEWGWSYEPAIADIDNNGWADIFIPKRNVNGFNSNNALFRNVNGIFTKITNDVVALEGGYSDAGVFGDFTNDGLMDLYVTAGSTSYPIRNYLYKNVTMNAGHYIVLKLRGCIINRSSIGTRAYVVTGSLRQMKEVSGGTTSQSMLWLHFGLGNATSVDSIIIKWGSGGTKILTNVTADQFLDIADGDCPLGIINNQIPVKFELKQNYPNPFNPETQIEYSILKPGHVKLWVYDITGRIVQILVDGWQNYGVYKVNFSSPKLSSGVYIYKIETDNFTDTKKMVLIK